MKPAFVGGMARVQRRRALVWNAVLVGVVVLGAAVGWFYF